METHIKTSQKTSEDYSLRLINENDITILYDHFREFLSIPNAAINTKKMPPFSCSRSFVLKYLHVNEHHEYKNWYIIENSNKEILGNCWISKKFDIAYHVLKKYQRKGVATFCIEKIMELNPSRAYNVTINWNNIPSRKLIEKIGFIPKQVTYTNES